jgi:hypothetical protein
MEVCYQIRLVNFRQLLNMEPQDTLLVASKEDGVLKATQK